jgi:hypothetical protein
MNFSRGLLLRFTRYRLLDVRVALLINCSNEKVSSTVAKVS